MNVGRAITKAMQEQRWRDAPMPSWGRRHTKREARGCPLAHLPIPVRPPPEPEFSPAGPTMCLLNHEWTPP